MLRIKGELRLWQPEAVESVLRDALALVERIDPPTELREAVFTSGAGLLAQKQAEIEQVAIGAVLDGRIP